MPGTNLYDDLIMDHIRNARNYRVLDDADHRSTGTNPLCGDEIVVYLRIAGGRIADVGFQCTCCGISMASASIMTEMVMDRPADEARALLREMIDMLKGRSGFSSHEMSAERRAMLETVEKFPARTLCAALPWATLEGALDNREHASAPSAPQE